MYAESPRQVVLIPLDGRWWGYADTGDAIWTLSENGFDSYADALQAAEPWACGVKVRTGKHVTHGGR